MKIPKTKKQWYKFVDQNIDGCYVSRSGDPVSSLKFHRCTYSDKLFRFYYLYHDGQHESYYIAELGDLNRSAQIINNSVVVRLPSVAETLLFHIPVPNQIRLNKLKKIYELT